MIEYLYVMLYYFNVLGWIEKLDLVNKIIIIIKKKNLFF